MSRNTNHSALQSENSIQPKKPVAPSVYSFPSPQRLCCSPRHSCPTPDGYRRARKCHHTGGLQGFQQGALEHFTQGNGSYHRGKATRSISKEPAASWSMWPFNSNVHKVAEECCTWVLTREDQRAWALPTAPSCDCQTKPPVTCHYQTPLHSLQSPYKCCLEASSKQEHPGSSLHSKCVHEVWCHTEHPLPWQVSPNVLWWLTY